MSNDQIDRATKALTSAWIMGLQTDFGAIENIFKSKLGAVPPEVSEAMDKILRSIRELLD